MESTRANISFGRGKGYNQAGRGRCGFFKDKVFTHYGKNGHTMDVCYRKHGYPLSWGAGRRNLFANNAGTKFQEVNAEMKMTSIDEGNMSLTQEQYKGLIDLLEKK